MLEVDFCAEKGQFWRAWKVERRGWTRFTRPRDVIGLQLRSSERREANCGFAARARHSVAVRKVCTN